MYGILLIFLKKYAHLQYRKEINFTTLSILDFASLEKDQIKDICVLIDCICEILIQTKEVNQKAVGVFVY